MKLKREVSVSGLVGTITDLCFNVLDTLYLPLVVDPNAAPVSSWRVRSTRSLQLEGGGVSWMVLRQDFHVGICGRLCNMDL